MKKQIKYVYVVTKGEYSDYHIEAIFSSKQLADKFVGDNLNYNVEKYPLNLPSTEWFITRVSMVKDGSIWDTAIVKTTLIPEGLDDWHPYLNGRLIWNVKTDNQDYAVKIVSEKRRIILANDAWDKNELTRNLFKE